MLLGESGLEPVPSRPAPYSPVPPSMSTCSWMVESGGSVRDIGGGGPLFLPPTSSKHLSHHIETPASFSARSSHPAGLPLPLVSNTKRGCLMLGPSGSKHSSKHCQPGDGCLLDTETSPQPSPALPGLQTLPPLSTTPHSNCSDPKTRKVPLGAASTHPPCSPQLSPSVHSQVSSKSCPHFPSPTSSLPIPSGTPSGLASVPSPFTD